jgi:AcrR family transcriptional regulator
MPMKPKARIGRPVREPGEVPTKDRILDAAIGLFAEKGYAGTSVREIARAVGLSEGALYKHFEGKEALLAAILEHFDAKIFEAMPSSDPGASVFRVLLGGLPDFFAANPRVAKIGTILMNESRVNGRIRAYIGEAMEKRGRAEIVRIFKAEIAAGRLSSTDAEGLADMFNALRVGWLYENYLSAGTMPGDTEKTKRGLEGIIAVLEDKFCKRRK